MPLIVKLMAKKELEFVNYGSEILMAVLSTTDARGVRKQALDNGILGVLKDIKESKEFQAVPKVLLRCERLEKEF